MKFFLPVILAAAVILLSQHPVAAEPYRENGEETENGARIFDWPTLELLQATKVAKAVKINAQSSEELVAQLEKILQGIEGAPKLRFVFPRQLWEHTDKDGTVSKAQVKVVMNLGAEDTPNVLRLVIWVSELNLMTFSVKRDEIIFRPKIG